MYGTIKVQSLKKKIVIYSSSPCVPSPQNIKMSVDAHDCRHEIRALVVGIAHGGRQDCRFLCATTSARLRDSTQLTCWDRKQIR